MSFQSYTFLFALLPVSVAGWWLLNWRGHGRLAQGFLLVVSLAFYGKGNLAFLPLLLGSILFNFLVGKAMGALPRARKPLLVLGLLLGGRLTVVSAAGVLDLLYLAFICGAGYVIWALLMKNNPVSRIAIFGFVNPVVNVLLSAVLNGEPLFRWQYLAALVFVCVGIWLVNKAPAKKEAP